MALFRAEGGTVRRYRPALCAAVCLVLVPSWAARAAPAAGETAPDFTTKTLLTRQPVTLSSAQGKLVFLTFWASWCPPCRKELPVLEKVQRKLGTQRALVYAVSFKENDESAVRRWAHDNGLQLTLLEDFSGEVARKYDIHSIPHLFIIGRDGKILKVHTGYGPGSIDHLVKDINEALQSAGEPASAATTDPQ
jgi:peroxiredoxin